MTREQFAVVHGYLACGTGKELTAEAMEVYFDCLDDLDFGVMQLAAKRVLMEHPWPNFPSVAELRQAAVESNRGEVKETSATEAWDLAWGAISNLDPELPHTIERTKARLPPLVWQAIQAFPLNALVYGDEPVGVLRGQFLRMYSDLAARERRKALMQPATLAALDEIRERKVISSPASPVAGMLADIGKGVDAA